MSGFTAMTDGPFFDDLTVGDIVPPLPAATMTDADNAWYRAITGDQHLATADHGLHRRVSGSDGPLVNPGLVVQMAIGQTTNATRRAIANLYYRAGRILGSGAVGQTLSTEPRVLGLADASARDGVHRGKVWLGVETRADDVPVVRYERVALLPCRGDAPGHATDLPGPDTPGPLDEWDDLVPDWDLSSLPSTDWTVGEERADPLADHVDLAAAMARFTFNQAAVHRDVDASPTGRRLVYGGLTQGLAQASLTRLLPGLATVVGWYGCDHLGPVFEGDRLEFRHRLAGERPAGSGRLLHIAVHAARDGEDVLAWTPVVWAR